VLDPGGRLAGVVSLARLARVPPADRGLVRLGDVLTPPERVIVLDPASPLADAAPALSAGGSRLAVVAVHGHVSGVVSAGDIARAVELAPFRPPAKPAGRSGNVASNSRPDATDR
jgi:CBS domain-containing protein